MKNQRAIYIIRFIHTLVAAFFIFCIGQLYYFAFTGKSNQWINWIIAILVVEGVVLLAYGCPLMYFHRRYGDKKIFFSLFMPEKIANYFTHFLAAVAAIGIILFYTIR